ncbi:hypothetical protein ACVV7M_004277 [Vibrio vulnificus]|uniref:hypothetical protein n=1 Tax=Vibrio vulnificus TaxID=672 RepID=UPI000CD08685|nr:hypothetical protein [Vibrio vulnificus]ELV8679667.1 hypothetical protein [Vibrio vulnificus]MCU8177407.1 hypothetical protein [Vibrio vulnificus]MCU8242879.1 hypothetical protein [Vibrio vulnificus]MCU8330749.1 hypothetical protein [Vibrio vulnificus]MCU8378059.1 hypothetical protein [Vibrio vulnificus]
MNENAYSQFSWYKLMFLIIALVLILLNSIIVFAKIDSEGFFNRFLFYVSALDLVIIACVVFKVRAAVEALCISTTTQIVLYISGLSTQILFEFLNIAVPMVVTHIMSLLHNWFDIFVVALLAFEYDKISIFYQSLVNSFPSGEFSINSTNNFSPEIRVLVGCLILVADLSILFFLKNRSYKGQYT